MLSMQARDRSLLDKFCEGFGTEGISDLVKVNLISPVLLKKHSIDVEPCMSSFCWPFSQSASYCLCPCTLF